MIGVSLLVALLFAGAAQRADSEPRIGTRIPSPIEDASATDASRLESFGIIHRMGPCVVKADAGSAMGLLATIPGVKSGHAGLNKVRPYLSKCLVSASEGVDLYGKLTLKFNEVLLRGSIAQALYRLQFAPRPRLTALTAVAAAPILPADQADPTDGDLVITYAFAQCLTQAHPAAVRSLILSKLGSKDEAAAFALLEPSMSPCLTKGTTLKTQRDTFRLMLAESLYRWSITAGQLSSQRGAS